MPASMQPRSIYPIRHMVSHLQHYNHGAILFEGDQRAAQVINLGHGGTSIGFAQRQRCQTFAAVPIASGPVSDIGFLIETSCGTSRPLSALRPHEAMGMLGAQEVMMQVSDPLPAGNRHIQIFYAILEVR